MYQISGWVAIHKLVPYKAVECDSPNGGLRPSADRSGGSPIRCKPCAIACRQAKLTGAVATPRNRKPGARNNYILVVFDSCRLDSFRSAKPRVMRKLGKVEARWSYASWTAPSHYNLLMGLMPHSSPRQVYASEYYKKDFFRFNERLGAGGIEFKSFVPRLYLPVLLQKLGYGTHAMVSLPVLNPTTVLNSGFDSYKLM